MTASETADPGPDVPPPADLRRILGAVVVPRDVVRVTGPEAIGYLHGQLSQDVEGLAVGATAWSFVLQPAGKVDAWVRLTRTADDELLLDVDGGFGDGLVTRLRRFLLRTKADIETLDWACVALRGPGAGDASAAAGGPATVAVQAGWPHADGVDLLGPQVEPPAGVSVLDRDAYEALRIRCGVPSLGAELSERTIPAEAGQWIVDASVSFTKGCFTGQELVARIDSRGGNVPRRLRGLVVARGEPLPGDAPVRDAPVTVEGKEVGRVTSAARSPAGGYVALAYLARAVEPPAAVEIRAGDREVPATAVDLPME